MEIFYNTLIELLHLTQYMINKKLSHQFRQQGTLFWQLGVQLFWGIGIYFIFTLYAGRIWRN
jgi:hypothetical protein